MDEKLAERVRKILSEHTTHSEKRMFGGLCFLIGGNMACGVTEDRLMVRVGKDAYEECLARPHARPMDFTGRPMRGMVFVDPSGTAHGRSLAAWVRRGADFAASLPRK